MLTIVSHPAAYGDSGPVQVSGSPELRRRKVRRHRRSASRRLRPELGRRHLARPAVGGPRGGSGRARRAGRPARLVGDADQGARPGLLSLQDAPREEHRRAGGADHRGERQDRQRGARRGSQVGRADRVRLLAAADRAGRGARGEPRRGMPDRALSARRRRGDHAVQLSQHGAELVDPRTRSRSATV